MFYDLNHLLNNHLHDFMSHTIIIMGRKVKQLKNYTTAEVEALFESDENNIVGVKLYAIIQLTRGYSARKLQE